jgi:hypothetical protein
MQRHKQVIQLSDHVKNKIRLSQTTPFSISSDELILSDNTDNGRNIFSISLFSVLSIFVNRFISFHITSKSVPST